MKYKKEFTSADLLKNFLQVYLRMSEASKVDRSLPHNCRFIFRKDEGAKLESSILASSFSQI